MNNLRYRSYLTLFIFISFRILLFLFTFADDELLNLNR